MVPDDEHLARCFERVFRDRPAQFAPVEDAHATPDGTLRFVVSYESGDSVLGFDGYTWRFVSDLLQGRAVIAIARTATGIRDVWVTDAPEEESRHLEADERLELRSWDGSRWEPGDSDRR
jgi:hypothetical protein